MIDFLVIGGGIAGVSAGARLSQLGQVLLIEAEDALGYHASGRSAAMFEETYGLPSTIALNRASKSYHMEANGGVLSPRGLLLLGTGATSEAYAHDLTSMEMEEIGLDEGRRLVPILSDVITRVGHHADAWDIDTDRLIQNFARDIRDHGGELRTAAPVTAIRRTGNSWVVTAGGADIEAREIINAAGAWADRIAEMAGVAPVGLQPYRRSMARIPAPGGHDLSQWPMIFGAGETWYAKPDAGALLVSPADEDPVEPMDAWAEDMVLAEGLARYQEHVTEQVTRMIANWAGLRSFAPDRNLVLGPDPAHPSFIWCAGQGGYGMQSSPAASQLIADTTAGRVPEVGAEVAALLSPARFRR